MHDKIEFGKPGEIEARSMEIIAGELGETDWKEPEFSVVRRCIHTSADFDYNTNLRFSQEACKKGIRALRAGADIVTDTRMAMSGINKRRLTEYGGQVHCFIDDETVIKEAKERGVTRSAICMERGAAIKKPAIFAIGNAPTALIRLYELVESGAVRSLAFPWVLPMWWSPRNCLCGRACHGSLRQEERAEVILRRPYAMPCYTIKMKWSFRDGTDYIDGAPADLQSAGMVGEGLPLWKR